MNEQKEIKTCCICHKKFRGWGNDPWPLYTDDPTQVCCDGCNKYVVIPARLERIEYGKRKQR